MNSDELQRRWIEAMKARQGHEARADKSHHYVMPVERTLGNRIVADRRVLQIRGR